MTISPRARSLVARSVGKFSDSSRSWTPALARARGASQGRAAGASNQRLALGLRRGLATLFLERHLPQFDRGKAAGTRAVRIAADGADVAPVVQVAKLALDDAIDADDLQQCAAGDGPRGQAHGPIQQPRVLE